MKKVISKLKKEIKLWKDLKKYVNKHLKGKTLTNNLEKEVDSMIKERENYLRNLEKKK